MLKRTMVVLALVTAVMGLGMGPKVSSAQGESESGLNTLVQQLIDARRNYGENLHRLIEYYEKMGNAQGQDWGRRELNEFGRIRQREYLPGLQAKLVAVNLEAMGESDIVEALVGYRQAYRKSLEALVGVLKGAKDVRNWGQAKRELKELISVNK